MKRFRYGRAEEYDQVGQVTGLAWTEVGGELLTIESAIVPGKGKMIHTGQLGDVMQESIQAATHCGTQPCECTGHRSGVLPEIRYPYPRTGRRHAQGWSQRRCRHVYGTGISPDNIPVRADVAMTGEITLRGEVLPIGGLKEKLLAAHRGGISIVLIPEENRKDLADMPRNVKDKLDIRPVRWIDEVLQVALLHQPDATAGRQISRKPSRRVKAKVRASKSP